MRSVDARVAGDRERSRSNGVDVAEVLALAEIEFHLRRRLIVVPGRRKSDPGRQVKHLEDVAI